MIFSFHSRIVFQALGAERVWRGP